MKGFSVKVSTRIERFGTVPKSARARVWVDVVLDGMAHSYVLVSGPAEDVEAYFSGEIDLAEVRRRWHMPAAV